MERRCCYKFGGEVHTVTVGQPVVAPEHGVSYADGQRFEVDDEQLLDMVSEIMDVEVKWSALEVLKYIFPGVCPKSLITAEINEMLTMESFCREYHVPPLGAERGYLDYPIQIIDIFGTIGIARERVRSREIAEMKSKAKK